MYFYYATDLREGKVLNNIRILKIIGFKKEDMGMVRDFYPLIDEHIKDIVDNVVSVLAEDYEVALILKNNNLSVEKAKSVFVYIFKFIFSHGIDNEFFETVRKVGLKHVEANVKERIVLKALSLFRNRIIETIFSGSNNLSVKHILAVNKLFDLVGIVMISSYRDELNFRNRALIKFMGINEKLLERIVEEGKK